MLAEGQKQIKWEAVAETIKTTDEKNDKKYFDAIKRGDLAAARQMLHNAARYYGYTIYAYHGSNASFNQFDYARIGSSTGVNILGDGFYFTSELTKQTQNDIVNSLWYSLNTLEGENQKTSFIDYAKHRLRESEIGIFVL